MMKKNCLNKNKICSIVCIVLLVAVMAAQFLPFWHGEFTEMSIVDGQKVEITDTAISVAEYVWFPKDHSNFSGWLAATAGEEMEINDFVLIPALQLFLSFLGVVALVIKFGKYQPAFFAGVSGVLGLVGFLTSPYLKVGSLTWLFIVIDVLLIIAFVATFVIGIIEKRKNRIV